MSVVLEQIFQVGFLAAILRIATPLAFATLGEMFSERAGVLNLGIEGIMLLSAMTGFTAAYLSGSLWLGIAAAIVTGALMGALHGVLTVALGLSQHVCGIGVTLFGTGLAYFLYRLIFGQQSTPPNIVGFKPVAIPFLSDIPILGPAVFNQFTLVYLAIIAIPVSAFVLYRTPWGLSVRMVGENPRAADSAGVGVVSTRMQAVILGGAGLAGLAARVQPHVSVPVICSAEAGARMLIEALRQPSAKPASGDLALPAPVGSIGLSSRLSSLLAHPGELSP